VMTRCHAISIQNPTEDERTPGIQQNSKKFGRESQTESPPYSPRTKIRGNLPLRHFCPIMVQCLVTGAKLSVVYLLIYL
jgi:hypothetical protein